MPAVEQRILRAVRNDLIAERQFLKDECQKFLQRATIAEARIAALERRSADVKVSEDRM